MRAVQAEGRRTTNDKLAYGRRNCRGGTDGHVSNHPSHQNEEEEEEGGATAPLKANTAQ